MKEKTKRTQQEKTRMIAGCGILVAASFVLQLLEFPIAFLIPPFVKFDFSDLPALIGAFAYGPIAGIIIEFVKNVIHIPFGSTSGVGELANFMLGAVFTGSAGLIYSKMKSKKGALIGGVIGAFLMATVSFPTNEWITYPVYYNLFLPKEAVLAAYQALIPAMKSVEMSLLVFNVPFTLVKGLVCVGISMLIYKPLSGFLHGRK